MVRKAPRSRRMYCYLRAREMPFRIRVQLNGIAEGAVLCRVHFSFSIGRYPFTPELLLQTVWAQITDPASIAGTSEQVALFNIRLPRVLTVLLAGAGLAVSGAAYQGMFKNPLVSSDILGAGAGASLGAVTALLFAAPNWVVQLAAFTGGMLAVALTVGLGRMVRYDAVLSLMLGGMLVSTLFQSGVSLVKYLADGDDRLPVITFWLMGSFSSVDKRDFSVIVLPMLAGFALLLLQGWKLNVLSFGDEEARSLGINTRRTRLIVIFCSTLLVSCSVAIAGIVGWVGLVIPHLARAVVGPNYRVLLPASILLGAGCLLLIDDLARCLSNVETPIGILTSIIGVPFFVFIFRRTSKGW